MSLSEPTKATPNRTEADSAIGTSESEDFFRQLHTNLVESWASRPDPPCVPRSAKTSIHSTDAKTKPTARARCFVAEFVRNDSSGLFSGEASDRAELEASERNAVAKNRSIPRIRGGYDRRPLHVIAQIRLPSIEVFPDDFDSTTRGDLRHALRPGDWFLVPSLPKRPPRLQPSPKITAAPECRKKQARLPGPDRR